MKPKTAALGKEKKAKAAEADLSTMSIDEALELLNSKYGANTFVLASKGAGLEVRFIRSGSHAFDFSTGGGFPENRMTDLHGAFSSFKSTMALCGLAEFQKIYPNGLGVYIDLERTFDRAYAKKLGVVLKRTVIFDPDNGEMAVDGGRDILELPVPLFVILDSVAALKPSKEYDLDVEDQMKQLGLRARLVGKAFETLNSRMKRDMFNPGAPSVTVVTLNQIREKIGVMFGSPETTPGGRAKEFYYSISARLSAGTSNEIRKEVTIGGIKRSVRFAQTVDFKIKKNKTGGPQNEEGSFTYYFRDTDDNPARTFDNEAALLHYGRFFSVIEYDDKTGQMTYGDIATKKEKTFIQRLREADEEVRDELYFAILAAISKTQESELDKHETATRG